MISIICEHCKSTLTTGTGLFVANNGNVQFFCGQCQEKLILNALKTAKPVKAPAKRAPKSANGTEEAIAAN